jgi:redox-sensitive bicupin YhaK (pirin superfamily)
MDKHVRFLVIIGKPLNKPVERGGPFVMNSREEIDQAFADYRGGKF